MFIGHFALGFAAKRAAPRVNLATLCAAAQLPDLVWPPLVALGIERVAIAPGATAFTPLEFVSYPWSHSLLLVAIWGAAFAALHFFRARSTPAALLLGALAVSHWVLDFATHRPDLPLYPGGARYGLGLWNSVPLTVVIEAAMFVAGTWLYARATRAREGHRQCAFVTLVIVLLVSYAGNIISTPPSITAVWSGSMIGFLLLLGGAVWVERNRVAVL
jgi:hypothetical protein